MTSSDLSILSAMQRRERESDWREQHAGDETFARMYREDHYN